MEVTYSFISMVLKAQFLNEIAIFLKIVALKYLCDKSFLIASHNLHT
jgi:hypothetical protein